MSRIYALNKDELDDPLWLKIEAHLKYELEMARKHNDQNMRIEDTNIARGRIWAFKNLLALNPNNEDI